MAVIVRDNDGNVIRTEASAHYVSTRTLRNRHEQKLCDAQMGIERPTRKPEPQPERQGLDRVNYRRALRGQEPIYNNEGYKPCTCEDYPCCGH